MVHGELLPFVVWEVGPDLGGHREADLAGVAHSGGGSGHGGGSVGAE